MERQRLFVLILEIVLAASVCLNVVFYTQVQQNMPIADATAFNQEFGQVPIDSFNYHFSPPITIYKALQIGLENDGWNSSALQNMTIRFRLNTWHSPTQPVRLAFK